VLLDVELVVELICECQEDGVVELGLLRLQPNLRRANLSALGISSRAMTGQSHLLLIFLGYSELPK